MKAGRKQPAGEIKSRAEQKEVTGRKMKFLVNSQISNRSGKEHTFIRFWIIFFDRLTFQAVVAHMHKDVLVHSIALGSMFEILLG